MNLDADALLSGPRGRGLLALLFDDVAIRTLTMRADSAADLGTSSMFFMSARTSTGLRGLVDEVRARRERSHRQREMRTPVTAVEMAAAIAAAPEPGVGTAALIEALGRTVDNAKAWQPPDGNEAVLASDEVRTALKPFAALVVASPFASTWAAPARAEQWVLDKTDDRLGTDPVPAPAVALEAWREAVEAEEGAAAARLARGEVIGGTWWSMPPGDLTRSTSAWPEFGPTGLYLEEDSFGVMAADAMPVGAPPAKTYEITDAESWARLCAEYPLDVTASRGTGWKRSVGQGERWVIPDWQAMAADWDAVHLTIAGYLAAATSRVDVPGGRASTIAGWSPDETVWLTSRPGVTGLAVAWRRYDLLGWRKDVSDRGRES